VWHREREKKHPGDAAARQKRYRDVDPMRERANVYRWREKNRHVPIRYMQQAREAAILAYGGFECACCGETQKMFLALDHIKNDGANDRRNNAGSNGLYYRLKKDNYPAGLFQVLCHNCNWGKYVNGGICPHKDPKFADPEGSTTISKESRAEAIAVRSARDLEGDRDIVFSASRDAAASENEAGGS